ncbi:MAG TPA: hypothetical protein VNX66_04020 [Candidatus Sulfotelmatobacter sp.]|nr:hypothetical protein [Candidatus Sulfotelmatobacter sp.]
MSTADYISRGIHALTAKLGLTTLNQNLTDPVTQAINDHAAILDNAAIIVAAPATATSTGKPGQIAFDATHIYVCVATNVWVRATLATF